nr:NADH dehydrogenase [ubiquinone] 1 beta subcomplex subunit 7 isoform X3 [Equus caballus]
MGAHLARRYLGGASGEPDPLRMPTFPPDYGFPGRKERGQGCLRDVFPAAPPTPGTRQVLPKSWLLSWSTRDGGHPAANERRAAGAPAAGLLCPPPHPAAQVQAGQLPQLPGLQA